MDKNKKGFSLLELLLVLGIIAALVVSAFVVYPKVRDARYIDIEAKHIAQIYASVKTYIQASLITAGYQPQHLPCLHNFSQKTCFQKNHMGNIFMGRICCC
ncbi:prepilin-type N-terminal cleavage/methylation domain-containing protein [Klebsiella pneumoniae]|uniref:Prepilin-type N-terminal cleavage/methylation domain-containing protein n=1 Tax=Klebsiella pneumoniae TaxID=573 RepID=A0A7X1HTM4_KLEPN|nr:prepilin-type N-terminal cleavage/methylation domain-containing protein [Klebsiella pneumoniae]MBC2873259.1 prepilin-type N-terminal cleavage/methylation domain-containing protein [Klebsiella pneumoniae]